MTQTQSQDILQEAQDRLIQDAWWHGKKNHRFRVGELRDWLESHVEDLEAVLSQMRVRHVAQMLQIGESPLHYWRKRRQQPDTPVTVPEARTHCPRCGTAFSLTPNTDTCIMCGYERHDIMSFNREAYLARNATLQYGPQEDAEERQNERMRRYYYEHRQKPDARPQFRREDIEAQTWEYIFIGPYQYSAPARCQWAATCEHKKNPNKCELESSRRCEKTTDKHPPMMYCRHHASHYRAAWGQNLPRWKDMALNQMWRVVVSWLETRIDNKPRAQVMEIKLSAPMPYDFTAKRINPARVIKKAFEDAVGMKQNNWHVCWNEAQERARART